MVEERNVYRVLMGRPEGKRPLGRPRCRWEDGIRMDLREICWGSVDWIQLAEVGSCECGDEPGSGAMELTVEPVLSVTEHIIIRKENR
jgi:hypothetical protein